MFEYAPEGFTSNDFRWMPVRYSLDTPPIQRAIEAEDIAALADEFGVPAAHIDAVLHVEAGRSGFLLREPPPARPKILFEGHYFHRLTHGQFDSQVPTLSYRRWTRKHYLGGSREWDRLETAWELDQEAALQSASWGLGQVMGANHKAAGCDTVQQFVEEAFSGEPAQLRHMINFIKNNGLLDELRRGDWDSLAHGYNGPGYRANAYDHKLAQAARHSEFA